MLSQHPLIPINGNTKPLYYKWYSLGLLTIISYLSSNLAAYYRIFLVSCKGKSLMMYIQLCSTHTNYMELHHNFGHKSFRTFHHLRMQTMLHPVCHMNRMLYHKILGHFQRTSTLKTQKVRRWIWKQSF